VQVFVTDLDGTLLDVRERMAHAHAEALDRIGYHFEPDQIESLYRVTLDAKDLLTRLGVDNSRLDLSRYIALINEAFYANWKLSRLIPGALGVLEKLRKTAVPIRLITSRNHSKPTQREIRKFGLHRFFDRAWTREELALEEGVDSIPLLPFVPHRRRLIQLAIRDVSHDGDVWVVGDTAGELEAARSLKFTAIGVLTGFGTADQLAPFAHHVLDSIADMVRLI
jgi:phosphoglycolate phosphatase-like HAD superfamily hydrolase